MTHSVNPPREPVSSLQASFVGGLVGIVACASLFASTRSAPLGSHSELVLVSVIFTMSAIAGAMRARRHRVSLLSCFVTAQLSLLWCSILIAIPSVGAGVIPWIPAIAVISSPIVLAGAWVGRYLAVEHRACLATREESTSPAASIGENAARRLETR